MQYRTNPKNGDKVSALAFGCMRFHKDEKEVERQIRYAIDHGVNYFDTAYIYPGSEAVLGRILAKGLREKVYIATKLPHYLVKKQEDFEKIFRTELKRLQTDYIDYYLIHMLTNAANWARMVDLGILDWIAEKKRAGSIRNIGFSFHGAQKDFFALLDVYPWDFCMIQYNYYDEQNQAGKAGLQRAAAMGLPVMVMEPLRGGTLVHKLPKTALQALQNTGYSPAAWGLRWVLDHPEVLTVLSGMGTQEMVEENVRIASEMKANTLRDADLQLIAQVRQCILQAIKVPCTGCGYCMPCPAGVDIPLCFSSYNDLAIDGKIMSQYRYVTRTKGSNASLCIKCGKCESHCPQAIPIRQELAATTKALEGGLYGLIKFITSRIVRI